MMRYSLSSLVLVLLSIPPLAGCSSDAETLQSAPQADIQELTTETYSLDPGQEKYLCYTFRSPAEKKAIIHIEPVQGETVHHVALFRTTSPEPDGSFECPQLTRLNWEPIWAGGAGADALDVPDGAGFVVEPGTQYLSQYHLLNASQKPVSTKAQVQLIYADDAEKVTPAGIFALGAFSLTIPALAQAHTLAIECNPSHDLNVFAIFPHMHKLGKSIDLAAGKTSADAVQVYQQAMWTFGEQPMAPLDLKVTSGDYLRSTCQWDNPSAVDVKFGESSNDEMCFTVLFYYPFTGLDGCINP